MTKEPISIGGVVLFGAHLLHDKMLEMITWGLKNCEHNLQAVFISDTGPLDRVGSYSISTRSLIISLPQICEKALKDQHPGYDNGFSISTMVWIGTVWSFFHELHHNAAAMYKISQDGLASLTEKWWETQDDPASEWAWEKTEEVVIRCEGEVPPLDEIPFAIDVVGKYLISEVVENPKQVRIWKDRMDKGIVFESGSDCFDSLKNYFLETTQNPERFEKENPGAALEMVAEKDLPSLFDQKILPGQQGELFGKRSGSVSGPSGELGSSAILAPPSVAPTEAINTTKGEDNVHFENGDDDYLPPEAYGDDTGEDTDEPDIPIDSNPFDATFPPDAAKPAQAQIYQKPIETGVRDVMLGFWDRLYETMFSGVNISKSGVALTETEAAIGVITGSINSSTTVDAAKTGAVFGTYYVNGTVPAYDIMINWNGISRRVKLIAQNPAKNSSYAERARNGERIAWLLEAIPGQAKSTFHKVCENGIWRVLGDK